MEDSRNIIKAIDALTLKAGGEVVDSKNITEAIDNLRAVYDESAIGIDKTLTQEGVAADAKAAGDQINSLKSSKYSLDLGNILPENADLNEYIVPGVYNAQNTAKAVTIVNKPSDISEGGFKLIVECLGSSTVLRQTVIAHGDGAVYTRIKQSSTSNWKSWNAAEAMYTVYRGKITNSNSVDISAVTSHTIYLVAIGNWSASRLLLVFPNNGSAPIVRQLGAYENTDFDSSPFSISENGNFGITITSSSETTHALTVIAITKSPLY